VKPDPGGGLDGGDSSDPARPNAKATTTPKPLDLANRLSLRPAEAARCLGVSERTLRSMLSRLPHFREGGNVLIPVAPLQRWLELRAKQEATGLAELEEEFAARIRASLD
jgi:excisionase family DNA binding protein